GPRSARAPDARVGVVDDRLGIFAVDWSPNTGGYGTPSAAAARSEPDSQGTSALRARPLPTLAERIHDELGVPRGPVRVALSPELLLLVLTVRLLCVAEETGELFFRQVRADHCGEPTAAEGAHLSPTAAFSVLAAVPLEPMVYRDRWARPWGPGGGEGRERCELAPNNPFPRLGC